MAHLVNRFASNARSLTLGRPMTNEEMHRVAPSIFAEAKHESRSERYAYIPTINVLDGLRREGFLPFMVGQSRSRVPGKAEFTKHIIRLRHADKTDVGGSPEVILINSHDGTSSYQMLAGYFRFVCMNGLVCGEKTDDIRVMHKGDITQYVVEGAHQVLGKLGQVTENREIMQQLTLNRDERQVFAQAALVARYGEETAPIRSNQLLETRRVDDRTNDLWTTYNVVQENMIQGGLQGRTANLRRTTTREIKGIDANTNINRALWTLATEMAKLKSAA